MKCCHACFQSHADPIADIPTVKPSLGNCDLCGTQKTDVWEAQQLADSFVRVIDHYIVHVEGEGDAQRLSVQIQKDWAIFSPDAEPRIHEFLDAVFEGQNEIVTNDERVSLRSDDDAAVADHTDAWQRFSKDLKYGNRYFPSVNADNTFFEGLIASNVKPFEVGLVFYRARVCDDSAGFPAEEMGMPPPGKARAGRANPRGIPHLYLAMEEATCIQESRASQYNLVTVATFEVKERLTVLSLVGFGKVNPFQIAENAARELDASRTLEQLDAELRKPLRPSDDEVEYVPTQYLSGMVKRLELDGILYSSSLHPGGVNLVLFDESKVVASGDTRTVEVTGIELKTGPVNEGA